ncbi:trypsin-like serine protease [bacterium]|nr:trypsin-like serine protease [bacterium]
MDEIKKVDSVIKEEDKKEPFVKKNKTLIFYVVLSFMFGVLGGGFYDKVLMPFLESAFKNNGSVNISDKVEKITVEENSAVIDVAEKLNPSVVTIISKNEVYDFFGGQQEQKGAGTGFVITADGMILTNKHVVSEKNADLTVITSDGKDYVAKVLSLDPLYDLAILKIEAKDLKVVDLGDSDDLKVGQRVVAIGNALGEFENSVTAGVISGKGRPLTATDSSGQGAEVLEDLLQTDDAINPGNSGGPLINLAGQVIGINTAVASSAENIGFAIPINIAKPAIESAMKTGKITRPVFGIYYMTITKEIASAYDLAVSEGVFVYSGSSRVDSVKANGPADKAGIKEKDVITQIGVTKLDAKHNFISVIQKYKPGDEVEVTILRGDKTDTVKVTLSEISG